MAAGPCKTQAICDSGCSRALVPKSFEKFLTDRKVIQHTVETAYSVQRRQSVAGIGRFRARTIDGKSVVISFECTVSSGEGRFLLPFPRGNTDPDAGEPYMVMENHKLPIRPFGEVPNLWVLDVEVLPVDYGNEDRDIVASIEEPGDDIAMGEAPVVTKQPVPKVAGISLGALRDIGIVPLDVRGVPLTPEEAKNLLPLWIGVVHTRICHYGPVTTHRLLNKLNIPCSLELVKQTLQQCKVCRCKVTFKNPEKPAHTRKRGGRQAA